MATKKRKSNGYIPPIYRSYNFRDKDPVIDELRTKVQDAGVALSDIKEAGGPSVACMSGWFVGKTKRPQNATVEACGRALGFQRVWRKM